MGPAKRNMCKVLISCVNMGRDRACADKLLLRMRVVYGVYVKMGRAPNCLSAVLSVLDMI